MAIRTSDFALLDFFFDARPGIIVDHFANTSGLVSSHVIEVENNRIALSAIYARMRNQVFLNAAPVGFGIKPNPTPNY